MRIFFDIVMFIAVLFTPFWLLCVLAVIGLYVFPRWYEVIAIFVIFDLFFRSSSLSLPVSANGMIPLALYAVVVLIGVELLRDRIRK